MTAVNTSVHAAFHEGKAGFTEVHGAFHEMKTGFTYEQAAFHDVKSGFLEVRATARDVRTAFTEVTTENRRGQAPGPLATSSAPALPFASRRRRNQAEAFYFTSERSPMMPRVSAAMESPARRPPPTSDVVDMSEGRSSSGFMTASTLRLLCALRSESVFHAEDRLPPTPHQTLVASSTKPANEDA